MNPLQALAVFAGIPLAIMLLIALAVLGPSRWRRWREMHSRGAVTGSTALPEGIARRDSRCWVLVDVRESPNGYDVHHDRPEQGSTGAMRQLDAACWTLRCANCGADMRDEVHDVHFPRLPQATAFAWAWGWTISASQVRCPRCSTQLGTPEASGEGSAIDEP